MSVVVVTPPAAPLVDLALVKAHLRVEHGDHDAIIAGHLAACAEWLDGPSGVLGRALAPQTLRLDRVGFGEPCGLELPCGPVQSIETIVYRDSGGAEQVVAPEIYQLDAGTNRVRPAAGRVWPAGSGAPVSVTYVAGYAEGDLPPSIRAAILLHLNILYDRPVERELAALERSRDALLSPKRKRRV